MISAFQNCVIFENRTHFGKWTTLNWIRSTESRHWKRVEIKCTIVLRSKIMFWHFLLYNARLLFGAASLIYKQVGLQVGLANENDLSPCLEVAIGLANENDGSPCTGSGSGPSIGLKGGKISHESYVYGSREHNLFSTKKVSSATPYSGSRLP